MGLLALFVLSQPVTEATRVDLAAGLGLWWWKLVNLAPLTATLTAATAWLCAAIVASPRLRASIVAEDLDLPLLCAILVAGFWLSFAMVPVSLVRYSTMIVFPTVIVAAWAVQRVWPARGVWVAATLAVASTLGQSGIGFPELPPEYRRSGELLERSREWLDDQHANLQLVHELSTRYADRPVLAKYPFVQMLCSPALGFVSKPLPNLIALGAVPTTCPHVPLFSGDDRQLPPGALYIYAPNTMQYGFPPPRIPGAKAVPLWVDRRLGGELGIYQLRPPTPRAQPTAGRSF